MLKGKLQLKTTWVILKPKIVVFLGSGTPETLLRTTIYLDGLILL